MLFALSQRIVSKGRTQRSIWISNARFVAYCSSVPVPQEISIEFFINRWCK